MADQPQSGAISAAFPAPPPFYKYFTEQNLERVQELQSSQAGSSQEKTENVKLCQEDLADLPSDMRNELRYLVPPAPPADGKYWSFGGERSIAAPEPSLPLETEKLYTSPPMPTALLRLTRSILLNFLEFVHILATNPADYPAKWEDLRDLFRNAHHAVNEYRPYQAREALIKMLEDQIQRSKDEIHGVQEMKIKVDGVLKSIADDVEKDGLSKEDNRISEKSEEERYAAMQVEEERRVWVELEMELD